jgi:pimeloyl-ACP methyl ester carboxylesterase
MNATASQAIVVLIVILGTVSSPIAGLCQDAPKGQTISLNGIDLYYEVMGEGEPLVLLHSFTNSGRIFDPFIDAFASNYRLIIPDLRGHGGSTNPGGEFTMRQSALDIFALLDHLEIDSFKAIGFSAGAVTLLHMATQQPERIEAVALVGSGMYYTIDCRKTLAKYDADNFPEAGWNRLRQVHKHGDEQIRNLIRALAGFAESYDDVTFTPPTLAKITARTLFVHGDRDYCFPVSMVEDMYTSIPRSYLWIIPNGGHVPVYGRWKSQFTETVLEFMNGDWEGD